MDLFRLNVYIASHIPIPLLPVAIIILKETFTNMPQVIPESVE